MAAQMLLHGDLHATVYEIDKLHIGAVGLFFRKVAEGVETALGLNDTASKMYATIDLDQARVGRTRLLQQAASPRWNESFHIYCAHMASEVIFTVKVNKAVGAELIGRAYLPVSDLIDGQEIDTWLQILDTNRKPIDGKPKLHVKLHYFALTRERFLNSGLKSPNFQGVAYTFFPQREGCRVTLYQDAHVEDDVIPTIPLSGGKFYEPHRCWEDVFDAIYNAQHFIYITGWSVYTEITLVRDSRRPKAAGDMTLGELLIKKADEGVRVLLLVWNDVTSIELLKPDGFMMTHDEDTEKYFRNTEVKCVLCNRNPDDGASLVQGIAVGTMFTHHQKTVVVDFEGSEGMRRVVSFVGGIDLCDGRYDTQDHSLFRTLAAAHHGDFHQGNIEGAEIKKGGPREPWHDIHCKLEGSVAWDVLFNFEQRWKKQGGKKQLLLDLNDLESVIVKPSEVTNSDDEEAWNVQIFRSIDGGAAFGFPDDPEEAAKCGLVSGKDNIIDRSIQDAYIHAIRRADKFIYIENQYFLGSSFSWNSTDINDADVGALHVIPRELSLKICSKIESGEEFRVYMVLPMWPEGYPSSQAVQAILDWQRRTMQMMYRDIVATIKAKGIEADPRDYLTFFCLGNREVKRPGEYEPAEKPEPADSDYARAQAARRSMIYVHSKMMIVDDEYIIVGSANINQRSMAGSRDSEIAMGAYQPHHLSPARGEIHGFRMALWHEHMGILDNSFGNPESLECIQKVNEIGKANWDAYARVEVEEDLPGHLLSYPVGVAEDGTITSLPGAANFPDTNAPILGTKADYYPPILTT